jgi:hypothetical protein
MVLCGLWSTKLFLDRGFIAKILVDKDTVCHGMETHVQVLYSTSTKFCWLLLNVLRICLFILNFGFKNFT